MKYRNPPNIEAIKRLLKNNADFYLSKVDKQGVIIVVGI